MAFDRLSSVTDCVTFDRKIALPKEQFFSPWRNPTDPNISQSGTNTALWFLL